MPTAGLRVSLNLPSAKRRRRSSLSVYPPKIVGTAGPRRGNLGRIPDNPVELVGTSTCLPTLAVASFGNQSTEAATIHRLPFLLPLLLFITHDRGRVFHILHHNRRLGLHWDTGNTGQYAQAAAVLVMGYTHRRRIAFALAWARAFHRMSIR